MLDLAALNDLPLLWALAMTTLLHELGIPLPLSPAALFVGARVAAGAVDPVLPVAAIVAATLIGNAVWFYAGRRYGLGLLRLVGRAPFSLGMPSQLGAGSPGKWDSWSLVVGRFVPGVSLVAPPLAGARGMSWSRFLTLTAAGSLLYGIVIVGAGMVLHRQVESILSLLERFGGFALAAVAIVLTIYMTWQWRRRSRRDGVASVEGARVARAYVLEPSPLALQSEDDLAAFAVGVTSTFSAQTRATNHPAQEPGRTEKVARCARTRQRYGRMSARLLHAIRQPLATCTAATTPQ